MDPIATYEQLKDAIARAYPDMSKQLQRIARFALERPNDLALGTVAAIAEATEVQPSAMIRFANALGYGGFSEMQQVFRGHLVERSASYRERIDQMRRKQTNGARAPAGVLHQLVERLGGRAGPPRRDASARPTCKAAVKLIAGAPRIHVLAQRRAFPVAGYLAYALSQLELRTHLLDGAGGMLRESLRAIAPGDVLLVASFRNYSPEVIDAAAGGKRARRAGDRDHRRPAVAAEAVGQGLLRAGRRLVQALPLAGGAAVPGAGAGGQHRALAGRAGQRAASAKPAQGVRSHEERHDPTLRPHLHGPRRGRPLRRADRRPAGGHAELHQVPRRLAGQHRGRRGAAGAASPRCSPASATSTTAASCARRWPPKAST